MNSKKKQTVAVAMATALGVSTMMTPVAVYAQEEEPVITQEQVEENQTRQNASQQSVTVNNSATPVNGDIDINETNFPDEKFRDWITDNVTGADNGVLTPDEISKVTEIIVRGKSEITSIEGIEYFTALTTLDCQRTGITTLDVSNNDQLTYLNCYDTGIKTLDVSNNDQLTELNCGMTGITTLDVSSNGLLKRLLCPNTGITTLDVSNNGLLEGLYCYNNTGLKTLDVSNNGQLTYLNCYDTGIKTLDVSKNDQLTYLKCSDTEIKTLDVSNNGLLTELYCFNTGIKTLDVSKNGQLTSLYCYNTEIKTLDVSNNGLLERLNCSNTGIKTLDVSNNGLLKWLYCYNTGITSLDVSKHTNLRNLNCSNTPLAFLNLGNIFVYDADIPSSTTASLIVTSSSFDMTEVLKGIDIGKIKINSGATLNGDIVSGYTVGTPITYTYDCGTNNGTPVTLDVELNLSKAASTIAFAGSLDTTYTGKPIEAPTVSKTGSTGTVTFTYQVKKGDTWEDYNGTPTNAGTYTVQAHLAGDDFNEGAVSEYTEFTIAKAANSWTSHPALTGWTYGQQPNKPSASAMFGDVSYSYSDTENGTFTSDVPTNAGTWYVKAIVEGTANYNVLDNTFPFTIAPKSVEGNSDITITDVNSDKDVEHLVIKDLGNDLVKGIDYDVEQKTENSITTVSITFKGNYEGTITKTYTVIAVKPENKPQAKPEEKPKKTEGVQTGDNTSTGLLAVLSMLSAGCIALITKQKRKKKYEDS